MRLIYIHGAPAVGKLTVAKHLVQLTGARLFDNHVTIDLARSVFEFGQDGFWELVIRARILVLEAAAQQSVPLIVTTSCYSDPEDRAKLEAHEETLGRFSGEILPVFLHCSEQETRRRVSVPERRERGKISSVAELDRFAADFDFTPVPRANCLKISTEDLSACDTAERIVDHFGLQLQSGAPRP